jgi:Chromo (CHRromatin Organisation MOdifier) domain
MLSAVAEHTARKRAELGDPPKKKVNRTMYLVKWAGLGYEFCTWETKEDVGNDALIAEFHNHEKGFSEEADMPEEVLDQFLHGTKHINVETAGGTVLVVNELRSQLYSQCRGLEFLKFGMDVPTNVTAEMGPKASAVCCSLSGCKDSRLVRPREVVECLSDLVFRVARNQRTRSIRSDTLLPPCLTGEYDAIVPITSKGLMMNVGEINGSVAFLGYRQFPDGSKGPAEVANIIRNIGDKIIAVDGVSTVGKSFKDVINMLRESGKNRFAYMRFLESKFSVCEGNLASVGPKGIFTQKEMQKKFAMDRQRVIVSRRAGLLKVEKDTPADDDDESARKDASDDESAGSGGSFQPDSDEEELPGTVVVQEVSPSTKNQFDDGKAPESEKLAETGKLDERAPADSTVPIASESLRENGTNDDQEAMEMEISQDLQVREDVGGIVCREETTRSLSLRLLDIDVGYSSDEGGDDECVYYLDGLDETFAAKKDFDAMLSKPAKKSGTIEKEEEILIPASKTEFAALGDRSKLAVAVALSMKPPYAEDFETFPRIEKHEDGEEAMSSSPSKTKRSDVKVEQVNASTGEIIHVWSNIEAAAATLQLPLPALRQVLRGEYDEEIGEEVSGFKWRYALSGAKVTASKESSSRGGGGRKAKQAWLEFRDKLYDPSEPHIYKNGNRLRDYQIDGVNWLASTWYKRNGCILGEFFYFSYLPLQQECHLDSLPTFLTTFLISR